MCRVLEVSRSGYYAWKSRPEASRCRENRRLLVKIREAHARSKRRYGSPRIYHQLRAEGIACSENRVARLMRRDGIQAKQTRKFKVTTDSAHSLPVAPNLLKRRFEVARPNAVWVSDITYVWTREGWLYLAVVIDLYSRRVVGWSVASHLERSLVLTALEGALRDRRPETGLIHHSDRGSQYASAEYQAMLRSAGIRCSMSRRGNCWDNAPAEAFFSSLKMEVIYGSYFDTRAEAKSVLFEYVEAWYNRQRLHSSLGYASPVTYEITTTQ